MLTVFDERDGERVLTVYVHEAAMDAELVSSLASVVNNLEHGGIENFVLRFSGRLDSATGDFPSWRPDPDRSDMRHFARWEETLSRILRLKVKTFAAYDGRVGAAALQVGMVMDLRLAAAHARFALGGLVDGRFPGMGAYWLPKFIGLGNARRICLLGDNLPAEHATRLGLVDVVEETVETAVDATIKATRRVTPEEAYFTRRLLGDCYFLEHSAAVDLAKAARFKLGTPNHRH